MIDNTTKSSDNTVQSSANEMSDPWIRDGPTESTLSHPARQMSLDFEPEIAAVPEPAGMLSPEGDPTALQIPARTSQPAPTPTEVLLQDEMKVKATQAKSLWDHIRDVLALVWWRGPQNE